MAAPVRRGFAGRRGGSRLIRTDGAGGTHKFVQWLTDQQVAYSVGFGLCESTAAAVDDLPDTAWIPAIDATGTPRKGAWVAELTGSIPLKDWPKGCGSSSARNGRTPVRNCGSPTRTVTG